MKIQLAHTFEDMVSAENLLEAWSEFIKGKRSKPDMQAFSERGAPETSQSYLGLLRHGNTYTLQKKVSEQYNNSTGILLDPMSS